MSRRHSAKKREVIPDRKYGNTLLAKFINIIMKGGKKSVAERLVYGALSRAEKDTSMSGIDIFIEAMDNLSPAVELRSCRVGGVNYQIPVQIKGARSSAIGMKWLISAAMKRKGVSAEERMFFEIMDARLKKGAAMKRYEDNYKMAESNRAFSHFRFFGNRSN